MVVMAHPRVSLRLCVFLLLFVKCFVCGQELLTSTPQQCNVPLKDANCTKVNTKSGIVICGTYQEPWPLCHFFCTNLLVQRFFYNSCSEKVPTFGLFQRLLAACTKECSEFTSGDDYYWEDTNLGFLIVISVSSMNEKATIDTHSLYFKQVSKEEEEKQTTDAVEPTVTVEPIVEAESMDLAQSRCSGYACIECKILMATCPDCCP